MSEQMTRVAARRGLEQAAFGGILDQAVAPIDGGEAELLLSIATLRPLLPEETVAIGQVLERYKALMDEARMLTMARERGNNVDFWRYVAGVERIAREVNGERA